MKIAVASGKGGTGKTLVSTNLVNVIAHSIYVDCDVEEPNGHIFFPAKPINSEFVYMPVPVVDDSLCNYCGKCSDICQFNAIISARERVMVFPELCHGCGGCMLICPQYAITEVKRGIGTIEKALFNNQFIYTGRLNVGEPMSPPLINALKEAVQDLDKNTVVIYDAPPGTSCPMVTSIKDADAVVLVTEPTPFGLNDLKLAVDTVRKLQKKVGVVINKSGESDNLITDYLFSEKIPLLMSILHDSRIAQLYSRGLLISNEDAFKKIFIELYEKIQKELLE